jgi:hypothetical protein
LSVPVLSRTFFGDRRRYNHFVKKVWPVPRSSSFFKKQEGVILFTCFEKNVLCCTDRARKFRWRPLVRDRHWNSESDDSIPLTGPTLQHIPTLQTKPRHTPLLRANPYPEVTDPICRLPLPTLFYRLEAAHLGDLLRIWVRSGATPPRGPLPDFQGPRDRSRHRRKCGALRIPNPISALGDSRELECLCRTENSASIIRRRLRVLLGYPDELLATRRACHFLLTDC